ncbi:MAG: hypothetical protein QM817_34860 [Archangium sp.]
MTTLVLLLLAQSSDFVTWTDASGVVHAGLRDEAPRSAKPVEAVVSVIDADGRPAVLVDGGTRADDTAWWRARLDVLRADVSRLQLLERSAAQEVSAATSSKCVTATATATVQPRTVLPARAGQRPVVIRSPPQSNTVSQTACVETTASPAQRAALVLRRGELDAAEHALRTAESEATNAGVPLAKLR